MSSYIRNSHTKFLLHKDSLIICGGKYGKKIKATKYIVEIIKLTHEATEEERILMNLMDKYSLSYQNSKKILLKLVELGFIEEGTVFKLEKQINILKEKIIIDKFCIPTCDRPESLHNCIESYNKNFSKFSNEMEYYIFDDSSKEKSERNLETLKKLKAQGIQHIFYIGYEEKLKFVEILQSRCHIDKNIVQFAFMPKSIFKGENIFTSGANRNFIQAYMSGQCYFTADDDSCCKGYGNGKRVLLFSSGRGDIVKSQIDKEALGNMDYIEDIDIMEAHNKYLGRSLKEIIINSGMEEINVDNLLPSNNIFPKDFTGFAHSKVAFTFHPIVGWPDQTADEALYDYISSGNENYLTGRDNKRVVERMGGDTIYSNPFLLTTTLTAFDGRSQLCPFIPIYRNEDVHYSYILDYLNPFIISCGIDINILHNKIGSCHRLKGFYDNFFGDIVLSYVLYGVLQKLKIHIDVKFLSVETRKRIFSTTILKICGKNQKEFTDNLCGLDIDLNRLWMEKRQLVEMILPDNKENRVCCFQNFENFIKDYNWSLIRKTLLLYSELLINWQEIVEECTSIRKEGLLTAKEIKNY